MRLTYINCLASKAAKINWNLNVHSKLNPAHFDCILTVTKPNLTETNLQQKQPIPQLCFTNAWYSTYKDQENILFTLAQDKPSIWAHNFFCAQDEPWVDTVVEIIQLTDFSYFFASYSSTQDFIQICTWCSNASRQILFMEHVPGSLGTCIRGDGIKDGKKKEKETTLFRWSKFQTNTIFTGFIICRKETKVALKLRDEAWGG